MDPLKGSRPGGCSQCTITALPPPLFWLTWVFLGFAFVFLGFTLFFDAAAVFLQGSPPPPLKWSPYVGNILGISGSFGGTFGGNLKGNSGGRLGKAFKKH